jgi:hypothetical protein
LGAWTEWKGIDGRFYCNEFCADGGETLDVPVVTKGLELPSKALQSGSGT